MFVSRHYSSENIHYYFNDYLLGNLEIKVNTDEKETEKLCESEEEFSFHYKKKN